MLKEVVVEGGEGNAWGKKRADGNTNPSSEP